MSLLALPEELKLEIIGKLNEADINRIFRVNLEFNRLCHDKPLWRELIRRRFGVEARLEDSYEEYKTLFDSILILPTPRMNLLRLLDTIFAQGRDEPFIDSVKRSLIYNGITKDDLSEIFNILDDIGKAVRHQRVNSIDELYLVNPHLTVQLADRYSKIYYKLQEFYHDKYIFRYNTSRGKVNFMLLMGIDPNLSDDPNLFLNDEALNLALDMGYNICARENLRSSLINFIAFADNIIDEDTFKALFRNCGRLSREYKNYLSAVKYELWSQTQYINERILTGRDNVDRSLNPMQMRDLKRQIKSYNNLFRVMDEFYKS